MASSRKRPIHETMRSVDGERCSARRLVKLRGLSLPARVSVGNSCLAAICTRLTELESVGHLGSRTAVTADLRALKQLRRIGPGLFAECATLTSVSLSGLSEMISVGSDFLRGCTSLTSVDLSGMPQLTSIGDYFISSCTSLTSFDLSGMSWRCWRFLPLWLLMGPSVHGQAAGADPRRKLHPVSRCSVISFL